MDEAARRVDAEGLAAGPDVALLVVVDSELIVEESNEHVASDVELPPVVEQGHQILLQDEALPLLGRQLFLASPFEPTPQLLQGAFL